MTRERGREPQATAPVAYDATYLEAALAEARRLAARHRIAYLGRDDLEQELYLNALVIYPKWDPATGGPGPFLRRALTRLVRNVYRGLVRRSDSPCPACKGGRWCGRGPAGEACRPHAEWAARWSRKSTLQGAAGGRGDGPVVTADPAAPPPPDAERAELLARLDAGMPSALRADFLRLKQGMALTAARKAAVLAAARAALGLSPESDEGEWE